VVRETRALTAARSVWPVIPPFLFCSLAYLHVHHVALLSLGGGRGGQDAGRGNGRPQGRAQEGGTQERGHGDEYKKKE
jgi:hypothetical protein